MFSNLSIRKSIARSYLSVLPAAAARATTPSTSALIGFPCLAVAVWAPLLLPSSLETCRRWWTHPWCSYLA